MIANHQSERFKFLDGFRGIAALAVVLFHNYQILNLNTGFKFPVFLDKILLKGHLGVIFFFVISGFVIAYSARLSVISFDYCKQFFIKRSIRLDPPYWTILILMIIASLLFSKYIAKQGEVVFENSQLISNVFYVQTIFNEISINPVAWTLCIELQLYVFFIVVLALMFKLSHVNDYSQQLQCVSSPCFAIFFAFLFLVSLEQHVNIFLPTFAINPHIGWAHYYWYIFFLGASACWAKIGWIENQWFYSYCLIALVYVLMSFEINMLIALCFSLSLHLLGKRELLTTWTCSSFFQYLGKISYSLYLVHWLICSNFINYFSKRIGEVSSIKASLMIIVGTLLAVAFAHMFYKMIEYPCLKLSQKIDLNLLFT